MRRAGVPAQPPEPCDTKRRRRDDDGEERRRRRRYDRPSATVNPGAGTSPQMQNNVGGR